jgi:hypothetical protein
VPSGSTVAATPLSTPVPAPTRSATASASSDAAIATANARRDRGGDEGGGGEVAAWPFLLAAGAGAGGAVGAAGGERAESLGWSGLLARALWGGSRGERALVNWAGEDFSRLGRSLLPWRLERGECLWGHFLRVHVRRANRRPPRVRCNVTVLVF